MNKNIRLSIAANAVNNTVGPEGITPTLLLFGATPKIALPNLENLQIDQKARFEAMEIAPKEMETVTAQRRVKKALKQRVSKHYPQFKFGDLLMVYLEELKRYEGPFTVHSFDNNRTVKIQIRNTIVPMSTSVVKKVDLDNDNTSKEEEESSNVSHNPLTDIVTELAQSNRDDADASSEVKNSIEHTAETFLASDISRRELWEYSRKMYQKYSQQ